MRAVPNEVLYAEAGRRRVAKRDTRETQRAAADHARLQVV